jgi:hypothetical protein
MNKTIGKTTILSLALLALSGHACADCTTYVAGLISYATQSAPARLQVSMTLKQGNGLSAASTPFYASHSDVGPPNVAEIDWNGSYLQGSTGKMLYSDRFSTGNIYGSPFSITAPDAFSIYVNATGHVWVYNQTWGAWTDFQGECSNNVLYGWGAPIGQNNGSDKAMYVISFAKISYGYL